MPNLVVIYVPLLEHPQGFHFQDGVLVLGRRRG
jgi:hypothetical protein